MSFRGKDATRLLTREWSRSEGSEGSLSLKEPSFTLCNGGYLILISKYEYSVLYSILLFYNFSKLPPRIVLGEEGKGGVMYSSTICENSSPAI